MIKYIVIEIQTYATGEVGTLITQHDNRNQAESKFHTVLASAAISGLPKHSCVLMTNDGFLLDTKCYEVIEESEPTAEAVE